MHIAGNEFRLLRFHEWIFILDQLVCVVLVLVDILEIGGFEVIASIPPREFQTHCQHLELSVCL